MRSHFLLVLPAALVTLAACSSNTPAVRPVAMSEYYDDANTGGTNGRLLGDAGITGALFNKNGSSSGDTSNGGAMAVNAFLWRGALDTLSFMPLASADPFGGVIITDWYQPPSTPDERFKATAYILGRQLRADGVRVSVFRQVRGANGQWTDAPVTASTTGELENKVLARARELRSQSASN